MEKDFSLHPTNNLIQIPNCIHEAKGVVILGAGISFAEIPSFYSLTRILGTVEFLQKTNPIMHWDKNKYPILFSGGITSLESPISESDVFAKYALTFYGPSFQNFNLLKDSQSKTTHENALYSAQIFNEYKYPKQIVLITNSFHMLRAKNSFENLGFAVCPVSVFSHLMPGKNLASISNGEESFILFHEYIGYIYYLIKGYIK